ncbi:transcriptional regulator PpsR [Palleronia caenipelagi]|uniref:Transcriptional regulator PpsR n=1 Tax=Palleronia caenipelagi TaxID=2489174 RepID=A0A547Q889_9RHOB|nr:transcriptional regulator PpsR [Palleronia caenipelagi]TRD22595.1 transcriptional regulator PpsR [Palleronia caenipelagi]
MSSGGSRYWSSGAIPLIGPDVLGDIIAASADLALVISDLGQILSVMVNPDTEGFDGLEAWQGQNLTSLLTTESIPKLQSRLAELGAGIAHVRGVELNHSADTSIEFPIRYSFHPIGPDGAILMLGQDLKHIAQLQQQLVEAQMALERDYEGQRESVTRMRALMQTMQEAALFVNVTTGRIVEANPAAGRLLQTNPDELPGTALKRLLRHGSEPVDVDQLVEAARDGRAAPATLSSNNCATPLRLRPMSFRAAGQRVLLCLLTRHEQPDETPPGSDAHMVQLYAQAADAIVFSDRSGIILSANPAFEKLVDIDGPNAARGHSFAEFLGRGSVDLKVLIDNSLRSGQMRLFATRMRTALGVETPVEISAAFLEDPKHPAIAFVIRDVSLADAMRPGTTMGEDMRPTRELVGSSTLKEIVTETTDVIEKMCIETALELTSNNRVAAAEMLGLSRQSLYVKLRKYDILGRDD